jgi:hypothetical protein
LIEVLEGDRGGMLAEDCLATRRNVVDATLGRVNEPCLLEVTLGPSDAIGEGRLLPAREELMPFSVSEVKDLGQDSNRFLICMVLAISEMF